ncbi:MAG: DUF1801 domain-containing protein [Cyclobacteriaceae bacterium]
MEDIASFILEKKGQTKALLQYFHRLLSEQPGLTARIRYKIPFYYRKSWVCYLNPVKKGGIELAFLRGNELSNAQGLLNFRGRKQVAGIIFYKLNEIPEEAVMEIIQEALLPDEEVAYAAVKQIHQNKGHKSAQVLR